MTHLANIFGYLAGYLDLGHWSGISWVGGGQFRKLAVISCAFMIVCVGVTCWTQKEEQRVDTSGGAPGIKWGEAWRNVRDNIKDLPLPVRRVCYGTLIDSRWHVLRNGGWTDKILALQSSSALGRPGFRSFSTGACARARLIPMTNNLARSSALFRSLSTTYIAEILYSSLPPGQDEPSADTATRVGSRALLLYALVAFTSGAILPWLSTLGRKPFVNRLSRTSTTGRTIRCLLALLTPRNFWTIGLALYSVGMVMTFWVSTVRGATAVIAFLGVPWSINCWVGFIPLSFRPTHDRPFLLAQVPFALVMESVRELQATSIPSPPPSSQSPSPNSHFKSSSSGGFTQPFRANIRQPSFHRSPARARVAASLDECSPLVVDRTRHHVSDTLLQTTERGSDRQHAGGTILGIHNLAIVAPQFFVAIIAAAIFKYLETARTAQVPGGGDLDDDGLRGSNDVVWVLRFGALASVAGVVMSRWVLKTRSEREYVDMLLAREDVETEEDEEEEQAEVE
jgi:solute carrier family 45 protein 1/2/4